MVEACWRRCWCLMLEVHTRVDGVQDANVARALVVKATIAML
jgi:hypothetical protein